MATQIRTLCLANNMYIERSIRTIKEQVQLITHGLPYKKFPVIMTETLVESVVYFLNQFPNKNAIDPNLSPNAMILGTPKLDYTSIKASFGVYIQAYTSTNITNTPRTVGAIVLKPSNSQGAYYCMSLVTGRHIHVRQWMELPITDEVI